MTKRLVMLAVVTMGCAAPALAQQPMQITDQQKHAVQAGIDRYMKAANAKDTKGIAALYSENGMLVGTYVPQPLIGRQAIEKYLEGAAQQGQMGSDLAVEADWKSAMPLGNNLIMIAGTWADTTPVPPTAQDTTRPQAAQSGSSQPSQLSLKPGDREHGSWVAVDELRGDSVLIRSLSYNVGLAAPTK
jgi:uncharacterized protein (TIGR02246 family)